MALRGDANRYGLVARTLHWLTVALFVILAAGGSYIAGLDYQDPLRLVGIKAHRTLGLAMLLITLARLSWLFADVRPPAHPRITRLERILSKLAHRSFYLLLLAIPALGFLFSGAAGNDVQFAGFSLGSLARFSRDSAQALIALHKYATILTVLVIAAHVAGVIKHHFKDDVKILRRML